MKLLKKLIHLPQPGQRTRYFVNPGMLLIPGLVILFNITGCKKEGIESTGNTQTRPRSAADGKNDLLGYGYDVTGEYGNSSASTFSVFNADNLKRDYPTRVEWDLSSKQEGTLTAGEDAESYLKKRAVKVSSTVGVSAFKATITASFSSSDAFSSKYVYSSFNLVIQQKRVKVNADIALLKSYLQPTFIADVQNYSAQTLVDKYGTHVLTDIILGAKLEIMYRAETSKSDRANAAQVGVDVGVGKVFSINTGYNSSDSSTKSNFGQSLHYKTYGGEPSKSLIGDIALAGTSIPTVNIKDWQNSSSVDNAELIDFGPNGMIPLYEFIDDPIKKEAVKTYINQYLKANQVVLINEPYIGLAYDNKRKTNDQIMTDIYLRLYDRDKKTLKAADHDIVVNTITTFATQPILSDDLNFFESPTFPLKSTFTIPAGQTSVLLYKDQATYASGKGTWGAIPLYMYKLVTHGTGYEPLNTANPW